MVKNKTRINGVLFTLCCNDSRTLNCNGSMYQYLRFYSHESNSFWRVSCESLLILCYQVCFNLAAAIC